MPVKTDEGSKFLKPYIFHGLDFPVQSSDQAVGDCPWCGKERKFYVSSTTGLWDCKSCGTKGNAYTFIRKLWEESREQTESHVDLGEERGLLYTTTLDIWGVRQSLTTSEWIIPGYDTDGKMNNLYRYVEDPNTGKRRLWATPTMNHQMFGYPLFNSKLEDVYVCEGPWDAMALWEAMRGSKRTTGDSGLLPTASESASLLSEANVVAVPGCNAFSEHWVHLFAGKRVILLYDNDHPRKHERTGNLMPPVGYAGMKRAAEVLAKADEPPKEIHIINWGKDGYDPDLPDGCDIRDLLSAGAPGEATAIQRTHHLTAILDKVQPIPKDWIAGRTKDAASKGGTEIAIVPCSDWKTLQTSWRKAMKWTDGLDKALVVMLSVVTSTRAVGDQLWAKIIGPASCGKSTLCEAISVAKKYVMAKSTIRGFHSGFQSDKEGKEDNSLISQLKDKTLVTKDGDTLLQSPNLGQILAEARDIYDTTSRTHYRNRMSNSYEGVRMTWLLCGTSSLRSLDSSELGERFLDCVIMEGIDDELEDEILLRVANRAERSMSYEANGRSEGQHEPEMLRCMQLTGGYVHHLRENAQSLLDGVHMPDSSRDACIRLGKFVAYMRARPSTRQDETAEREFAARLVSQIVRLAKCVAVVLNRDEVDSTVMALVRSVAMDTARGRTLQIAQYLATVGVTGSDVRGISFITGDTDDKTRLLLRFLRKIGVAEWDTIPAVKGKSSSRVVWKLTDRMAALYGKILEDGA